MPTKRNRAGEQQEYNESNGEYAEGTSGSGSTGATTQTASKTSASKTQKQSKRQKGESWEDWATRLDEDATKRGWEPDGFDGDTRFYDFEGGSASINPSGYTTLYDEDYNVINFRTPEEAYEFLEITSKEEAEKYVWDHLGAMPSSAEDYIGNKFANQAPAKEEIDKEFASQETQADDFDSDLDKAYEKHGGDKNAIIDEMRKKDYGMSNGDLQSVIEAYVMRKDTDKAKKLFGLDNFVGKK